MTDHRAGLLLAAKTHLRDARRAIQAFDMLLAELRPADLRDYIETTSEAGQEIASMLMCIDDDVQKTEPVAPPATKPD